MSAPPAVGSGADWTLPAGNADHVDHRGQLERVISLVL